MKFIIVKFKDGKYAARTGLFFYKFLDLKDYLYLNNPTWTGPSSIDKYCKGTLAEVTNALDGYNPVQTNRKDKGTPV